MGESEQINHIQRLSFIPFKGVVSLKQPEVMAFGSGDQGIVRVEGLKSFLKGGQNALIRQDNS